MILIWKE